MCGPKNDRAYSSGLVKDVAGPVVFVRSPKMRGVRPGALCHIVGYVLARVSPRVRGDVSVVITNDRTIRRLNLRYRGLDTPTDVLSFPLSDGAREGEPFGDILISHETARRQAREYGASLADEIARLAVHGALHLCGYDHRERKEAARMHGVARRLLRELSAGA